MEILIPGLILVALMVYASTRIKKDAAKAYDEEFIETGEFSIVKPDGFIIPVEENSELAFAAYSKDFGSDETDGIRQVSVELRIHENRSIGDIRGDITESASQIVSERSLADGTKIIEAERIENGVILELEYRLMERNVKVFELAITVLPETKAAQTRNIDRILASFEIK